MEVKVSIQNLDSIGTSMSQAISEIQKELPSLLQMIGTEMKYALQRHIQEDWYVPYTPSVYLRRTDNPELGTPLGSEENMSFEVEGNRLTFTYNPQNGHRYPRWDNGASGAFLVDILQEGSGGGWDGTIPPRPFWDNFEQEQFDVGIPNAFMAVFGDRYKIVTTATFE